MNPLLKQPSTDFNGVRDGRNSLPLYIDIDLTTARSIGAHTQLVIEIAANSFYADADTGNGGNATVHFQDTNLGSSSAPFFVSPGFIANVGFTKLLIENTAQVGKRMRIFYGVDIDFQAGVNSSITISGIVTVGNALNIRPESGGISYADGLAYSALTPQLVVSAAANVNGLIVTQANIVANNTVAMPITSLLAKATAPASIVDGRVICSSLSQLGGAYTSCAQLARDIFVPAGLGLYFISSVAESAGNSIHSCTYKPL